jgi:hypothetical protein
MRAPFARKAPRRVRIRAESIRMAENYRQLAAEGQICHRHRLARLRLAGRAAVGVEGLQK